MIIQGHGDRDLSGSDSMIDDSVSDRMFGSIIEEEEDNDAKSRFDTNLQRKRASIHDDTSMFEFQSNLGYGGNAELNV